MIFNSLHFNHKFSFTGKTVSIDPLMSPLFLLKKTTTALRVLMELDFLLKAAQRVAFNKKSVPHAPEKCCMFCICYCDP